VPSDARRGLRDATVAAVAYVALAIALTWPLALGIAHDVPSDLGDPLLNAWILARDADHLLRALSGQLAALAGYWQADIFYPHPYTLAYSEHLTAQAIQILPVYALTKNPLLCYNLIFLSTFALSGLGMFLLARELTADRAAAFVAGLAFGFAPYRFGSISHVQVLSAAWMPFVLLGFHRFFTTGRTTHLIVAAVAWIAQNLSCSYYMLFFSPVVALYVVWEVTARRLWRDVRILSRIAATVSIVVLAAVPFVIPYLKLRQLGFMPRSLYETDRYGADVYAYFTAHANLRAWGSVMRAWPKPEGWLFPGLTIAILALVGARASQPVARAKAGAAVTAAGRLLDRVFAAALIISAIVVAALLFGWSFHQALVKITSFDRALSITIILAFAWFVISPRARTLAGAWASAPPAVFAPLTVFAIAMSFGPHIHSRGKLIEDTNVYLLFYTYVPGFDGLRVPARFGMIVALGLATLVGYGVAALQRLPRGRTIAFAAGAAIVVESIAVPLPINGNDTNYKQSTLAPLPSSVGVGDATPAVYRFLAQLPESAAVLELPFGEVAFEVRYVFYSTAHHRRLLNGYSGGAPAEYGLLAEALKDLFRDPDRAWDALAASGATHVVVHEGSYLDSLGATVAEWLRRHGARELASFGSDRVFELARPRR